MHANHYEHPEDDDSPALGNRRSKTLQLTGFLRKQEGLSVWIEDDPLSARATVAGHNVTWVLSGMFVPGKYTLFFSHFPGKIPVGRRAPCAQAITRVNSGLGLGAFELDLSTGALIFRTAIPCTIREADTIGLDWMLAVHRHVFDFYFGSLMSVVCGMVDPEVAIRQIEGTLDTTGAAGTRDPDPPATAQAKWN